MAKKKQNAKRSQPPIAQNATSEATQKPSSGIPPPIHADDPYSRAVTAAVWEAIHAAYRGEFLDRFNLLSDVRALIQFCMGSLNKEDYDLIYLLAGLNIQMTTFLDNIVQNSDGEDFRRLRALARDRAYWPTMVRPGDSKFSEIRIKKLEVGKNSIIRQAEGRPVSLATPRNRLAAQFVDQLCYLAVLTLGYASHELEPAEIATVNKWGLQRIKQLIPKPKGQEELLAMLREIRQLIRDSSPLTKDTVKKWNRWISNFVLLIDPKLTHPELQKLRSSEKGSYTKTDEAAFRSKLEKFFHPALTNLSRSVAN
jgi:hypothetical protein